MDLSKKKILIIEQGFLRKDVTEILSDNNINAELLSLKGQEFFKIKKNFIHKYLNIFNRLILKKYDYWDNLILKIGNNSHIKDLEKIKNKKYDFAIIICPYHFSEKFILKLKNHTDKIIAYSWESLNDKKVSNYIQIKKYISNFFCFDKNTISKYPNLNIKYSTNFFYPIKEIEKLNSENTNQNIISYVGNLADRRDLIIEKILDNIHLNKYKKNIHIVVPTEFDRTSLSTKYNFNYLDGGISLHEYLRITAKSNIVIDIKVGWQNGFTFRLFEAVHLKKKIITTNSFVTELEFYHPNNIFIFNEESASKLDDFLEKPYFEISDEIINKYRADYWIQRILA